LKRSLAVRVLMALGVMLFVVGPATASMSSAASAARRHHHPTPPPPPPAPVATPGPIQLNPTSEAENSTVGYVGTTIWGVIGSAGTAKLNSPGLTASCTVLTFYWEGTFGNNALSVPADFGGNYNLVMQGRGCVPGTFMVFEGSHGAPFTILPPNGYTGDSLVPSNELQNTENGTIGTTVLIHGGPQATGSVSSPNLDVACNGAANVWGTAYPFGTTNLPQKFTTDFAGNAILAVTATDCNAGTYYINVGATPLAFVIQN
jgi:hypothetical protein